jgi:UDP-GlcNAc:undecaprenyl-phosphate GlcNAc-1-phosphate transferase
VSALVVLAATPIAALAVWSLLRSRAGNLLVAKPTADRWHTRPTPTFGGVAIFTGFVSAVVLTWAAGGVDGSTELIGILAGGALLFAAGLIDDIKALPPLAKLGAQFGAAAIVIACGVRAEIVSNDILGVVIAVVWLVGLTNAFNLLDNMDGLAASTAGIAALFFAIDAVTEHPSRTVLVLAGALGLACLGFLPFNLRPRRPAAVFMGDSGSQLLGFTLATLGMLTSYKVASTTVATLLLPILILAVPILDTTLVTIIRLLERRPVSKGGRDHTSHRLVARGLSEKRAVVLLGAIGAMLGATSLAYNVVGNSRITLVGVLVTFVLLVQFATFLGDVNRDAAAGEGGRMRPLALNLGRLLETLVDFAVVTAAFAVSYFLLVVGSGTSYERHVFMVSLPAVLVARFAAFIVFGMYRRVWRYAGSRDAVAIVLAVIVSEIVAFLFLCATVDFGSLSRTIFVINAVVCILMVGAARFGERALSHAMSTLRTGDARHRTLIVGAGREGRSLLRELRELPGELVVGFVDDDPDLYRRRLQGVPVLGGTASFADTLARTMPDAVLVTALDLPRATLDAVIAACDAAGVPCRFVRRDLDVARETVLGTVAGSRS